MVEGGFPKAGIKVQGWGNKASARAHIGGPVRAYGLWRDLSNTVLEITGYAKRLMSQTFAIFEIFTIAGMLYLVINLLLIAVIRSIERFLMRHELQSSQARTAPRPDESAATL